MNTSCNNDIKKVGKALFIHDGPLNKDSNGDYYSAVINNTVFSRYLGHAKHLSVAIRVTKFEHDDEAKKSKKIDLSNVSIVEVPSLSSAYGTIFDRKKAREILTSEMMKADIAIIRLPSFIGAEAVRIAKKLGKKYLTEIVGCPWDSLWNYGLKGKVVASFMMWSMKSQVKNAPYAIYVTSEFLQERYPTNGQSTNCSNVEISATSESVLEERLEHISQNNGKIILGTTADVSVPYKGHQYVIEAIAMLKKQGNTNYIYQMVGDGNRDRLEKIIENLGVGDQVQFMGAKTHEQVFDWLDTIDIYIQPSRQEGLPRALIEAMSRGLPCIGARTGGIPELIPSEKIFSNTSSNIREICDLLKKMTKEEMSENATANFANAKIYDIEKIRLRRNALLNSLTNQ